jgi:hypothetical protein
MVTAVPDLTASTKGPSPMRIARTVRYLLAGTAVALFVAATPSAASATGGAAAPSGTRSLAQVLTRDTGGFDRNRYDFDILTKAVLTVVGAKPSSPVSVLTDGSVALTAFIPNDAAFQRLEQDITNSRRLPSEQQAFDAVAGLGVDTVETVLLYHVVPGATLRGRDVALHAAAVTFYGGVAVVPVGLLVIRLAAVFGGADWVTSTVGPARPGWRAVAVVGSITAANLSGFLHGFVLFCSLPLDLGLPFGGLAQIGGVVAVALWSYLLHMVLLIGYALVLPPAPIPRNAREGARC